MTLRISSVRAALGAAIILGVALAAGAPTGRALSMSFFAFALVMVFHQTLRARTHGPRVNWIPARLRPKVNEYYRRKNWPLPYDSAGKRLSWWREGNDE